MSGEELAAPLGALPPVKIHCAQLVEGALRLRFQARDGRYWHQRSVSSVPVNQTKIVLDSRVLLSAGWAARR